MLVVGEEDKEKEQGDQGDARGCSVLVRRAMTDPNTTTNPNPNTNATTPSPTFVIEWMSRLAWPVRSET